MNLIGIVQAILVNIATIAGINDSQLKITPTGFLQMLLENTPTLEVQEQMVGMKRQIIARYMQRGLESDVTDVDDCSTTIKPTWNSSAIPDTQFNAIGIQLDDSVIRQLQVEAANNVSIGTPPAKVYNVLYQTLLVKINGLLQKMNTNLLTAQATAWGANVAYGNANAQTLAFGGKMGLQNGIIKLISDAQKNEIEGQLQIVGNGVVNDFQILNNLKAGIDAQGYGRQSFKVYNDMKSATVWGENHFGVFASGLTGFVGWDKWAGKFGGNMMTSIFFVLPMPIRYSNGETAVLTFDCQLKYNDCPDPATSTDRGWALIVSKNYALWNAPADMFAAGDRMAGFNGSLHYIGEADPDCITVCP